ncbi:MAG: CPBP family intramembrane metalloprotease, partial [Clostridiales Family XIII bacterium]|jgi:membrane protease YdiL (CAAX protease family)|nr:CPBP family intramembrane metalloprotease [Clostridiales Family XIII bacterium]
MESAMQDPNAAFQDANSLTAQINGNIVSLGAIAGIILGMLVFMIIRGKSLFTDVLKKPENGEVHPMLVFGVILGTQAVQLITSIVGSIAETIARNNGFSLTDSYSSAFESMLNPVGILYIALIGPICEEMIFRGACLNTLRKYGDNFAVVMSACLFGLYHIIIFQIPFALVVGIILGYAAIKFSLKHAIIIHAISNTLALFYVFLEQTDFSPLMFMGISTVVAGVILFSERARIPVMLKAGRSAWPGVFAAGFTSIAFLLYAVGAIGMGIGLIMMMT